MNEKCWLYDGRLGVNGYAFIHREGRTSTVHRVSYEVLIGPIPEGLELDHLCRVRHCYNPAHLEPVTRAENNRRMWLFNKPDRCRRGHTFTADTTYFRPNGTRNCRTCNLDKKKVERESRQ